MKKKFHKIVAVYLALTLLFQIVSPTVAFALTNGPSQPEMESFEPIGTTEMVDPFSGDFNYNIPLMTVPGPNGGYPLNLAYHAGIGMEQEASWVGLGWNINVGEISRQMRGLPDDFKDDVIGKQTYMRPNRTATLGGSLSMELTSADMDKIGLSGSLNLIWNNYKGIGLGIGSGISSKIGGQSSGFIGGLNMDYSSMSGEMTLSPSLSYSRMRKDIENKYSLSFSYGSVEGAKNLSFNHTKNVYTPPFMNSDLEIKSELISTKSHTAGVSFSSTSYIPHSEMPMTGFNVSTAFKWGTDVAFVNPYYSVSASYSQNKIAQNILALKGYGYLYSHYRNVPNLKTLEEDEFYVMDFNREKDADLVKDIPSLPVPVFTNDIYFAKGQGVGGAFRPYRSDVGILHDPVIRSKNIGVGLTGEVAPGNPFKGGSDMTFSYTTGYEGPWRDPDSRIALSDSYQFKGKSTAIPLFEPAYFRNAADMTANYDEETATIHGTSSAFPISFQFGVNGLDDLEPGSGPLADIKVSNPDYITQQKLTTRPSRSQMMSYKTIAQLKTEVTATKLSYNTVFPIGDYPRFTAAGDPPYTSHPDHHIGEVTVINPDGNRYIYGIAAYNNSTEETSFSVTGTFATSTDDNYVTSDQKLVNYIANDRSSSNSKNDDHFYTAKTLPEYAHSYLLTAIVSPDYVDLTNDGLSDDDYGYFVKFNYSKLTDSYQWRSPFTKANYIPGYQSTESDDKAGFVYGTKEIWYINSIETKTHMAEFTLSDRKDGFGADEKDNGAKASAAPTDILGDVALKKLDRIDLYSKSDPNYSSEINPATPIKTVHFYYTYDLCGNVNNNSREAAGATYYEDTDLNENKGKLTLKKVWFTYLNNSKGLLSPYEFDYAERDPNTYAINTTTNPNFSTLQVDRWGNYQRNYKGEYPYVEQNADYNRNGTINTTPGSSTNDEDLRNIDASAWCLRNIILPSGGTIKVEYESDDYAYVQDKPAMQMAKILGTANRNAGGSIELSPNNEITDDYLYILFELNDQSATTNAAILPYVENLEEIYFKIFTKLKKQGGGHAEDYVTGYAKVDGGADNIITSTDVGMNYGVTTLSGKYVGYVKVKYVNVHDSNILAGADHTHPFRKAGWQYMKLNRPDLLYPSSTNNNDNPPGVAELVQLAQGILGFFKSQVQLFSGFYNYCIINGFCKTIVLDDANFPSFIRVNTPNGHKYGGGHRVKSVRIQDTWAQSGEETVSEYGQEYSYLTEDNKSSGVAEYEPMIGGDEIALRKPVRYSSDYFIVKHNDLYTEEPYCESYYPAASVGYSRVIITGITHSDNESNDVTKGVQGIAVNEFYTAKDFPVIVTPSNLLHKKFTPDIIIPFIGSVSFENHGFSQTYTVETNDMHGKAKAVTTYPYGTDLTNSALPPVPVTKTEYIYKTDALYSASSRNHLNNQVEVLYKDAYYKTSELGVTKEFFMDMRERNNISMTQGIQANVEVPYPPPVPVIIAIPIINYSEGLSKSVVGMNIISRNGILTETRQYSEGAMASTQNLMFDAATGKPLLTTVKNNFDAPVYTYEYAAQWAYDGMGAAYRNMSAEFSVTYNTGTSKWDITGASGTPEDYLAVGDEVVVDGVQYWVNSVTSTGFVLKDIDNATYTDSGTLIMTIMRSGRRNQMSVPNGKIVSLNNPLSTRNFPLFTAWNAYPAAHGGALQYSNDFTYTDCRTGETVTANGYISGTNSDHLYFSLTGGPCIRIEFLFSSPLSSGTSYQLSRIGNKVFATTGATTIEGSCILGLDCFKECMADVLHADALQLNDSWTYDYDDVDNNQYGSGTPAYNNPYFAGSKGIWRPLRNNVYQIDRKRGAVTNIATNGTYYNFTLFDWTSGAPNPEWTWVNEITKFNPYGYEVENKDALDIRSSALYGYEHSVQTAIANNSQYYETAFDGLEDYYNDSYTTGHGHINLAFYGDDVVGGISAEGHTGKKSIVVEDGTLRFTAATYYFQPVISKKYMVSAWFKPGTGTPAITFPSGATAVSTTLGPVIDGWRKCDVVFTASSTTMTMEFDVTGGNGIFKLDDVRIQPFQSTMKTFVYNPQTLWLVAELDNQNYATYYNYDQEGTLVQVKKETVKGISTIKTTRSNVKQRVP